MEVIACQDKIKVNTVDLGYCPSGSCDSKACPQDEDPVCGSNGITYRNECIMKKIACEEQLNIELHMTGTCPQDAEEEEQNEENEIKAKDNEVEDLDEKCRPLCPRHLLPVCASNGKTYNNECEMKAAICRDESIKKLHEGSCDEMKAQQAG